MTMQETLKAAAPTARTHEEPILRVTDVTKHYRLRAGGIPWRKGPVLQAVDGVSLDVYRGETLGIVGESGCGKSTLARLACRLIDPSGGEVVFNGVPLTGLDKRALRDMRRRVQMVFQDPFSSLNPRMTVFEVVEEPLVVHGLGSKAERERRVGELLERMGFSPAHWRRYPHEFSGGQRQRIVIARALAVNPELVICDEPVSALDVSVQAQIINLLKELQKEYGLTYLFITHDLSVVKYLCDRIAAMYLGRVVELGTNEDIVSAPAHPYTQALFAAIPVPDPGSRHKDVLLKGSVPSPVDPPKGCRFHTRCPAALVGDRMRRCSTQSPALQEVSPGHSSACHFAREIQAGGERRTPPVAPA
jgi:oligopeptide transport system ATP-binding protein